MSFFQDVISTYREPNFDLVEFWQMQEPKTPPQVSKVEMRAFDLNALRDSILYNVCQQGLSINPNTIICLIDYLEGDFTDLTQKTYLQVLMHYTKMNVELLYDKYSADFDKRPVRNTKLTMPEFFNKKISSYISRARETPGDDNIVTTMPVADKEFLQNYLLTTPMLSAFGTCLDNLLEPGSVHGQNLKEEISNVTIYSVKKFSPLSGLRGACLTDGILVCTLGMAGTTGAPTNRADLVTLAAHECSHYLALLKMNDFNFSSPFKFMGNSRQKVQFDPVIPSRSLELGRYTELLLFDKIQPDWSESSSQAATIFLDGLHTFETIPIIRANEHEKLQLEDRQFPSSAFGIDLEEQTFLFC